MNRLCIICLVFLLCVPTSSSSWWPWSDESQINELKKKAYSHPEGSAPFVEAWEAVLEIQPTNLEAHVMLGWALISKPERLEKGMQLLEDAFDPEKVSPTVNFGFPQVYLIAATIGRHHAQKGHYKDAKRFTELALELSARHATTQSEVTCLKMQLATMLDGVHASAADAEKAVASSLTYIKELLNWTAYVDTEYQSSSWDGHNPFPIHEPDLTLFPGCKTDAYAYCMHNIAPFARYQRAGAWVGPAASYRIALQAFPELGYVSKSAAAYSAREFQGEEQPCISRKVRLAVIAGGMSEGDIISENFGGVLARLDRNLFDIRYLVLTEKNLTDATATAAFTKAHSADKMTVWAKPADGALWPVYWARNIELWDLDMILFPELTLSNAVRRLAMLRLAPVQINSVGYPITSGHDRSVVQYFISWAAAELPWDQAQKHYTEELKLLPANIIYQYFNEPQILPGQISRIDNKPTNQLTRGDDLGLSPDVRLYTCLQKPANLHPDFDMLVCRIMSIDKGGIVAFYEDTSPLNQRLFEERLERAGCDLSRIIFLDQIVSHSGQISFLRISTVVLDPHPLGYSEMTTRAVIELGKCIVTYPSRLLGGRMTLGYLSNIGLLKESTKKALVAHSVEEYAILAVSLATDDVLRKAVEDDIASAAPNLFRRVEAVVAWQELLLDLSPYPQCEETSSVTLSRGMQRDEL